MAAKEVLACAFSVVPCILQTNMAMPVKKKKTSDEFPLREGQQFAFGESMAQWL